MSQLSDTVRSMDLAVKRLCTEYMYRKFSKLELQIIANTIVQIEQASQILRVKLQEEQKSSTTEK